MSTSVNPIPDGASVVIPRLVCRDPAAAVDFVKQTFKAEERVRRPGQDGKLAHSLLTIGPAMIMIESEWPNMTNRAPQLDGTSPVVLFVYVEDVDQAVERAVAAGAKVLSPAANQFWGRPHRVGHGPVRPRVDHPHAHRRPVRRTAESPTGTRAGSRQQASGRDVVAGCRVAKWAGGYADDICQRGSHLQSWDYRALG